MHGYRFEINEKSDSINLDSFKLLGANGTEMIIEP